MNEQDEFAIKFGDWLHENCDPSDNEGTWLYYPNLDSTQKKNTKQLLKIFKDEMDKEN